MSLALTPVFLGLLVAAIWNPKGDYWGVVEPPKAQCEAYDIHRLRQAVTLTSAIYDQRKLDRFLREPQNTVSNIGYIVVGVIVLFTSQRRLSKSFGLACVFLGVGSGCYHATLLPEWRLIDILGVYAALMSLVVIGAASISSWFRRYDLLISGLIWLIAVATGIHRNDLRIRGFKPLDSATVVFAAIAGGSFFALLAWRKTKQDRHSTYALCAFAGSASLAFSAG